MLWLLAPGTRADERPRVQPKIRALLLNGGGSASSNYLSHFHHLQDMMQALRDRGLARDSIDVFSADGEDPKPDLVVRGGVDEDFWLIEGTALGLALRRDEATNSVWEGVKLHPASTGELRRWFVKAGKEMRPGDTVFIFVTDHGSRNAEDPDNGLISLWNESLSLLEFRALLGYLKPGVRVVATMSQCYSGAFADAMSPLSDPLPSGDVCGFYSTTRDRQAFGCYPEGRDRDRVGHAFHFIDSMERHPSLVDAHDEVLVGDDSPDVPIRTSDVFFERLLSDAADKAGVKTEALIDDLLGAAWKSRARWEESIRLLDRLGEVYGTFSPRTLKELDPRIEDLQSLSKELETYEDRWELTLNDLRRENLQQFLDSTPAWKEKTDLKTLNAQSAEERKAMLAEALPAIKAFTQGREDVWRRMQDDRATHADAETAQYRVDVRLAALARMRTILVRIAGLQYFQSSGDEAAKQAFARLDTCEKTPVGSLDDDVARAAPPEVVEPLPPFEKDLETVKRVLPSWLGINFRPIPDGEREHLNVDRGAVAVQRVFPDTPAFAAGIRPGDVVLGPPGEHFDEPNRIREWIMTSPRGTAIPLDILRGEETVKTTVSLTAYPVRAPALPAPPKAGDAAPPLTTLTSIRTPADDDATSAGGKRLVFFWATWCGPCKNSVPELLAWSDSSGVQVLAVTDEDPETVRKFLDGWTKPFPARVATDTLRTIHIAYGVSGTPTFVLIDEQGKIAWRQTGYSAKKGLSVPAWSWAHGEK